MEWRPDGHADGEEAEDREWAREDGDGNGDGDRSGDGMEVEVGIGRNDKVCGIRLEMVIQMSQDGASILHSSQCWGLLMQHS